ncbi:MAG TPA: ABC transporter permease [Bacillales bacterium]|nr:ABC transporter permease [Bacillales bacterium]
MSFLKTIHAEFYKFRKTFTWTVLFLSPIIAGFAGFFTYSRLSDGHPSKPWMLIYSPMATIHGMLFLPLIVGVIVALICRYEHLHGGWKQYLVQPVRRWQVYLVKFGLAAGAIAVIQLLMLFALLAAGILNGIDHPFPLEMVLKSLIGGWIATFPLIALQLWVSTAWSSFAAPMAINVICTIPSMLIANSATYGPYYPWAQPLLAMMPNAKSAGILFVSAETLFLVIAGSFVIFFVGGLTFFQKRAY